MNDKSPRFYSQHGEDYLLWKFFDGKKDGFYVDVGAFDGVHLSNSLVFERQGWQGICVEAHPDFFRICQENRPGAVCLNLACVGDDTQKPVTFYTEPLGLLSGVGFSEWNYEDVKTRYENRGLEFEGFQEIEIPAASLDDILAKHVPAGQEIDFVSIDVEGAEPEVLRGFSLERHKPRIVIIEANTEEALSALTALFGQKGYLLARKVDVNALFVRDEGDIQRLESVPIDCCLEGQLHPRGAEFTLPGYADGLILHESLEKKYSSIILKKDELIARHKKAVEEKVELIDRQKKAIQDKDRLIDRQKRAVEQKDGVIGRLNSAIEQKDELINRQKRAIEEKDGLMGRLNSAIEQKDQLLGRLKNEVDEGDGIIGRQKKAIEEKDFILQNKNETIDNKNDEIQRLEELLNDKRKEIQEAKNLVGNKEKLLEKNYAEIEMLSKELKKQEELIQKLCQGFLGEINSRLKGIKKGQ